MANLVNRPSVMQSNDRSEIVTTIPGPTASIACEVQGASGEAATAPVTIEDNDSVSVALCDVSGAWLATAGSAPVHRQAGAGERHRSFGLRRPWGSR